VSSGSPQNYVTKIFTNAGISGDRLHLDYQAKDTVTNFTTLVKELKAQGIDSVYLITSDNHMNRARIIGEIVFGTQGITLKPLSVPSDDSPEPIEKIIRDGGRSFLWLLTGKTGETLLPP
ncbi:YdcF family protein, partial [Cyanothece sp. BG0011]|uniref:YdcF family protein n=1 Tax=Cyanothece sp. BG0011 TaxID=2082950 RepID=UPI0018E514DE